MSFASKLWIENKGVFLTSVFYAIAGVLGLVLLPLANYPPHIGITGVVSLVTAYGLFKKRNWALYPVVMLFFVVTVLALYMLYYTLLSNLIIEIGMVAYLILTWITTAYVTDKRTKLES